MNQDACAAGQGDRRAAERVLRHLAPRVRNLIRYLIRGDEDVDDIAQTALLDILKGLPSYRGDAPLENWTDRIVARTVFKHLKRNRLRLAREVPSDTVDRFEGWTPESERTFVERRTAVQALDKLPEAQRVAVALHHAAGFTVPEIAKMLEVPPETAKSRIRLGMTRLRKAMITPKGAAS